MRYAVLVLALLGCGDGGGTLAEWPCRADNSCHTADAAIYEGPGPPHVPDGSCWCYITEGAWGTVSVTD